jgi:hypothetical protein
VDSVWRGPGVEGPARSLSASGSPGWPVSSVYAWLAAWSSLAVAAVAGVPGPRWCRPPPGGPGLRLNRLGARASTPRSDSRGGRHAPAPAAVPGFLGGTLGRDVGIRPGSPSRMPQCTSGVRVYARPHRRSAPPALADALGHRKPSVSPAAQVAA